MTSLHLVRRLLRHGTPGSNRRRAVTASDRTGGTAAASAASSGRNHRPDRFHPRVLSICHQAGRRPAAPRRGHLVLGRRGDAADAVGILTHHRLARLHQPQLDWHRQLQHPAVRLHWLRLVGGAVLLPLAVGHQQVAPADALPQGVHQGDRAAGPWLVRPQLAAGALDADRRGDDVDRWRARLQRAAALRAAGRRERGGRARLLL